MVIGVGPKSFTLHFPSLGVEHRASVDNIQGLQSVDHDATKESLVLTRSPCASEEWTCIDIRLFAKLRVKVSCRPKPPLDIAVEILGTVTASPLAKFDDSSSSGGSGGGSGGGKGGGKSKNRSPRVNKEAGDRVIKHALN